MTLPLPAHPDLVVDSRLTVWDGRFPLELVRFRNRRFDGALSGQRTWELWRRGRAGAVLPYDPAADAVVLIEQFRLPALAAGVDPVMLEVPAGLCDGSESAEETIRREAAEETGLTLGRLVPIGDYVLSPGGCDERVALFAGEARVPATDAAGFAALAGLADEHEDIRVLVWPAARAIEAALEGGIANAVTAIALLWLAARRPWLRAQWAGGAAPAGQNEI